VTDFELYSLENYWSLWRCYHSYSLFCRKQFKSHRMDSLRQESKLPGATSPRLLNFVGWSQIFVGLQNGTFFMSPFWCLVFWHGS